MNNEDFRIEELENETSNKSQKAKRIAATAGIIAAGGVGGYAATSILNSDGTVEGIDESDIDSVNKGANQIEPEKPVETVTRAPQPKHEPQPGDEVGSGDDNDEITFDKTTHYYDENNNLIATQETGTYQGRQFELTDVDGDMRADYFGYDYNGDGSVDLSETVVLSNAEQIEMGHPTAKHEDVFKDPIEGPYYPEDPDPWNDGSGLDEKDDPTDPIDNDFADEKTGEEYSGDYADNNNDYNNDADILMADDKELAYEEEINNDYESSDVSDIDEMDDSFDDIA